MTIMKFSTLILLIAGSLLVSGCYTQLETVDRTAYPAERERPSGYTAGHGDAYLDYYTQDDYLAYDQGYYDGLFDASLGFRYYKYPRHRATLGFHWGRPFYAFGFSYGHFYDPHWHYFQLYDPFFYSSFGFYGHRGFYRYRHFGHFYSPGFWGYSNYIVFHNYSGSGSQAIAQGPRRSGIHRGTVTNRTGDQRTRGSGIANRVDQNRTRGFGSDVEASPGFRSGNAPGVNRTRGNESGATVNRRPAPAQRAQPQRTRGSSDRGTVNRNRGESSSGNANRSRGNNSNNNRGTVNRNRGGNNSSSGSVNRNRGGNNSSASPQRSRGSSNSSGNRNRNRNNDDSLSLIQHELQMKAGDFTLIPTTNYQSA